MQHEHKHAGETIRQAVITMPGESPAGDTLTMAEAAAFLGFKKSYLYKLTSTRQIPFFKYGGRLVLFDRAALADWKRSRMQAVPTAEQMQYAAADYCARNPR